MTTNLKNVGWSNSGIYAELSSAWSVQCASGAVRWDCDALERVL